MVFYQLVNLFIIFDTNTFFPLAGVFFEPTARGCGANGIRNANPHPGLVWDRRGAASGTFPLVYFGGESFSRCLRIPRRNGRLSRTATTPKKTAR